MAVSINCTSNWNHSGCVLSKAIQKIVNQEDIFIKPELHELISEERAVLFTRPTESPSSSCEFNISIYPRFKIEAISILCSSPKIEIFIGKQKEYLETVYGNKVSEEDSVDEPLISYRYDIELEKSGITDFLIKFLTTLNEICIYGIRLSIAPNPNGITTLIPGSFTMDNVEDVLKSLDCKLTPNAEKCKSLLAEQLKLAAAKKNIDVSVTENTNFPCNQIDTNLKLFIDDKLKELETNINSRLDAITAKHFEKLDTIINMLANK